MLKKFKTPLFLILILILSFGINCVKFPENVEFNNPVDPEAPNYVGMPSVDIDGDGISSYYDVDDITILSPADGTITSDGTPTLVVYKFNPSLVKRYCIRISTSKNDFDNNIVHENDNISSNFYAIPAGVLENNTTYYWCAKAYDGTKWSDNWSEAYSFTLDITIQVPTIPYPINNSTISDTTPVLDWEDVYEATGYHIQVNTEIDFSGIMVVDDENLIQSNYQGTTIFDNNTSYYWRVRIKNRDGIWGDWSNTWRLTIRIRVLEISVFNNIVTVDNSEGVGGNNSIDLDSNGYPHISYLDSANDDLKYAFYDGTDWNIEIIDGFGYSGQFNSISLDSNDRPHISYCDFGILNYAYYDGTSWTVEMVDDNINGTVGNTAIALDSKDNPHISYSKLGSLKYAIYDGDNWNIQTVENNSVSDTSISLDSNDRPHISYEGGDEDLKYAYYDGISWSIETLDSIGLVGLDSSITLDSNDNPHISYHDQSNEDLKYVYYDGTNWNIKIVDNLGNVGNFTSLALDSNDHPHISYKDTTNKAIKYAYFDGTSWSINTLDSNKSASPSLVLNSAGIPHISYFDYGSRALKYFTYSFNIDPYDNEKIRDTTPNLDWENVQGAIEYEIMINDTNDFSSNVLIDEITLISEYQVIAILENNKNYYWQIRIKNDDAVWGDWSNTWSFNIQIKKPIVLSPSSDGTIADGTPLLDWEDVENAIGYEIDVSETTDFNVSVVSDATLTSSEYQTINPLENKKTYYWRVKIKNEDSVWGDWSNIWSFEVQIEKPVNPSPSDGSSIVDATPLLNWEDISTAIGYEVEVNESSDFNGTVIANENTLLLSEYQIINPLDNIKTYYWRVKIKNEDGILGDWSNTWSFEVAIYALEFDGTDDYVETALFDNNDIITIASWVKITGRTGFEQDIVCNFEYSGYGLIYDLQGDNKFSLSVHINGGYRVISSDTIVQQNVWNYVVGTYDGDNGYLYIDGVEQSASIVTDGSITDSSYHITFGANPDPGYFVQYFNGVIDEVSIWNIALTEQEIQNIMNQRLEGSENGLIGYWGFDEGQGQLVKDRSVNGNDGYLGSDPNNPDDSDPIWVESGAPIY